MKKALTISVVMNIVLVIFIGVAAFVGYSSGLAQLLLQNQERRATLFQEFKVPPESTVFLGDSNIELTEWDEIFNHSDFRNRGISGNTSSAVLERLDNILEGQPKRVFLSVGSNDIFFSVREEELFANYEEILQRLRADIPSSELYCMSTVPRRSKDHTRLLALNEEIQKTSKKYDCTYIDLYNAFLDPSDNSMRDDYSNDDTHFLGAGYKKFKELMDSYIS